MGFDNYIIYHVYIEKQNWVIKVKDLYIFENIEIKENISLPSYENKPSFQGFFLEDNNNKEGILLVISLAALLDMEDISVIIIPVPTLTIIISYIKHIVKPTFNIKETYSIVVVILLLFFMDQKVKNTKVG